MIRLCDHPGWAAALASAIARWPEFAHNLPGAGEVCVPRAPRIIIEDTVFFAMQFLACVARLPPALEIKRRGSTNVIKLYLPYEYREEHGRRIRIGESLWAEVLSPSGIADLIREDRRRHWRKLTRAAIANDTGSAEPAFSVPMQRRMAMKGRLARIMAESARESEAANG